MRRFGRRVPVAGAILGAALVGALPAAVAATDPGAEILIHEDDTHEEPSPLTVCEFHLHIESDEEESGFWEIWTADGGERVEDGEYEVTADEDELIPEDGTMTLSDGDYELRWDIEPVDRSRDEKDFAVECPEQTAEPTETPDETDGDGDGDEGGETAAPATAPPTLPPTDSLGGGTRSDAGFGLALLVLAGSLGLLVFARPLADLARGRRR